MDDRLANKTTFADFSWLSLHLYLYYWKHFHYIVFLAIMQQILVYFTNI